MRIVIIIVYTFIITTHLTGCYKQTDKKIDAYFNAQRAYQDVKYQLSLGPRVLGSSAHLKAVNYIKSEMVASGWNVKVENTKTSLGFEIQNIVAERGYGKPWIVIGAHYDSRLFADQELVLEKQKEPVPGANDGASGVAVLLELGRVLPEKLPKKIWLVFFDAEDNGHIENYDWIMGSQAFVSNLKEYPDEAIIVDMVGDRDLTLYIEKNSNQLLANEIWETAETLNKPQFINKNKYSILDDHTPFLAAGIPAIDIIDFDYPYWHTTEDTLDKISEESLEAVGETLFTWLAKENQ